MSEEKECICGKVFVVDSPDQSHYCGGDECKEYKRVRFLVESPGEYEYSKETEIPEWRKAMYDQD